MGRRGARLRQLRARARGPGSRERGRLRHRQRQQLARRRTAGEVRVGRAEGDVAASPRVGRDSRRVRAVGRAGRIGCGEPADGRAARRSRVRAQRTQGLGGERRGGRSGDRLRRHAAGQPRARRRRVPRAAGFPRRDARGGGRFAGRARPRLRRPRAEGRLRRRGRDTRRSRPRVPSRDVGARRRARRDRGAGARRRPGGARRGARAREAPRGVRPADRELSGDPVDAGRQRDGAGCRADADAQGRRRAEPQRSPHARGRHGEARRLGGRPPRGRPRDAGARVPRLPPGLGRRAAVPRRARDGDLSGDLRSAADGHRGTARPGFMSAAGGRRAPFFVFLSALALFTLTAGGSLTSSDSVTTFALTANLVDRHSISLEGASGNLDGAPGADGRPYSRYGIGQSIYNIPFYVAGKAAVLAMGRPIGRPDSIPKAVVALGSAVAAAGCVLVVWLLSRRLGAGPREALVAAASAAVASPLWPYSKFGFSTALTALVLLTAAWLITSREPGRAVPSAAAAGAVVAFGWLTRHEMAVVLLPFAGYLVLSEGRSRATWARVAAFVGCALIGGALWAWYNMIRFGRPLSVGYVPEFGVSGYAAFLVSPSGSILLFAPIAIVWLAGVLAPGAATTAARVLLIGPLVLFYLFYGALVDWPGGRSYGPRYLVPSLLLLAPGAALLWQRGRRWRPAIAAAILAGGLLQLPGVLVDYAKVSVDWARTAPRD